MAGPSPKSLKVAGTVAAATTLILVSVITLQAFPSPIPPSAKCASTPNTSKAVTLLSKGINFTVSPNATGHAEAAFPFCINESITFLGAWNATQLTDTAVIPAGSTYTCPVQTCDSLNGSYNTTLFPGSYDLIFTTGSWPANITKVTITQPVELLFDRTTILLQSAGTQVIGPMHYLSWSVSIPPNAGRIAFYSDGKVNTGFSAGFMDPSQWASFQANQSAFNWTVLSWFIEASGGIGGPFLSSNPLLLVGPGTYTFVFYNDNTSQCVLQLLTPLWIAYTEG